MDEKTILIAYLLYASLLLENTIERQGWRGRANNIVGRMRAADFEKESIDQIQVRVHQVVQYLELLRETQDYDEFRRNFLASY